jgi:hypothetical protein
MLISFAWKVILLIKTLILHSSNSIGYDITLFRLSFTKAVFLFLIIIDEFKAIIIQRALKVALKIQDNNVNHLFLNKY